MLAKTDFPMGLDGKTREAFKKTFDAMSEWRDEITASTERYAERVFDTFAVAARGVGWPESLINTTKAQVLQASKMQTQMMDRLMETWQDQLKSPVSPGQFLGKFTQGASGTGLDNAMANPVQFWMQAMETWQDQLKSPVSPGQFLGKFTQGASGTGLDNAMANPVQFWMQATQMWQKNWSDAMALWMGGKPNRR